MSENYSCLPNSTEMAGMTKKFKSRREEGGGYLKNQRELQWAKNPVPLP